MAIQTSMSQLSSTRQLEEPPPNPPWSGMETSVDYVYVFGYN